MAEDLGSHEISVRVYYEDTDAQGIVYFANYFRFMERGRTEWLRDRGVDQVSKPAKFDDELVVRTTVTRQSGARVAFEQNIYRDSSDGELLCAGECEAACLAVDTLKPQRLPAGIF